MGRIRCLVNLMYDVGICFILLLVNVKVIVLVIDEFCCSLLFGLID